ncbi:MAG: hypothetical protein QXY45_04350 [Candidatus Aenigmatarchaeota archaeon]
MGLFNRKKPEEKPKTDFEEIKMAVTDEVPKMENTKKTEEFEKKPEIKPKIKVEEKEEKLAPLFIKIDKYNSILNLLNDIRASMVMLKNALSVQKEIEHLAEQNRKLIEESISKIDVKLISLDSQFVRPKGFKEDVRYEKDRSGLKEVVEDLKFQLESLKTELEQIR